MARLFFATLLGCSLLISSHTLAEEASTTEESKRAFDFVLGGGLTFGGDDILEVEFEDSSDETLTAGGLIDIKAGMQFYTEDRQYSLMTTIGYHFDSVDATNGDSSFDRIPLDFIAFMHSEQHRLGLGVTYHTSVEWEVDFNASVVSDIANGTYDFDDSTGFVVEYGYQLESSKFTVGARAVFIDYELADLDAETLDGNHFGIYGYFNF